MSAADHVEIPAFVAPPRQGAHASVDGPNLFSVWRQMRFAECDPAGLVFYPRYFEMFHEVTEDWWHFGLGVQLNEIIRAGLGWPMVHMDVQFHRPGYAGDYVRFQLSIEKIGHTSLQTKITCYDADELRLQALLVVTMLDIASHKPVPIVSGLRNRLEAFRDGTLGNIDLRQPIVVHRREIHDQDT